MPLEIYILHPACKQAVQDAYKTYAAEQREDDRETLEMITWARENFPHTVLDVTEEFMARMMAQYSGTPPQVAMRGDE